MMQLKGWLQRNYLKISVVFLFVGIWIFRATNSLWIDEALSYWVIKGSFSTAFERAYNYHGQSPFYYLLLWCCAFVLGSSEVALRVLSLICMTGSAYFVYRIAQTFVKQHVATASILFFIPIQSVIISASSARPYGLAFFFSLAATYYFISWFNSGSKKDQLWFVFLSSLTIYAHYMFGGILLIQLIYYLLLQKDCKFKFSDYLLSAVAVTILCSPLTLHLKLLSERMQVISTPGSPAILGLFYETLPLATATLFILSFLIGSSVVPHHELYKTIRAKLKNRFSLWLTLWLFLPPLILFGTATTLERQSLFAGRYFMWTAPAAAILLSVFWSALEQKNSRIVVAFCFVVLTLAAEPTRPIIAEDWRSAVEYFRSIQRKENSIFLYYSGFIESKNIEWLTSKTQNEFLTAPALYYGLSEEPLILPYTFFGSEQAARYINSEILPSISGAQQVVVLGTDIILTAGEPTSIHIQQLLEANGFKITEKRMFLLNFVIQAHKTKLSSE